MVLEDNGDGTLIDRDAGLMWLTDDADDGVLRDYDEAVAFCKRLNAAGFDDWRLPTLHEIERLRDVRKAEGVQVIALYSMKGEESYWTSTPGPGLDNATAHIADGTSMFKQNKYAVRACRTVT